MSILETLEWSGPALALLSHCAKLDPGRPAVLHIRHTERTSLDLDGSSGDDMLSTQAGIAAAKEFGSRLPRDRIYRMFHTYVQRAKETADAIRDGINSLGGQVEAGEIVPFRYSIDRVAIQGYLKKVREMCGSEAQTSVRFTNDWLTGLVTPQDCILPSIVFAKNVSDYTLKKLESATPNTLDIYVSHDTYVGNIMFHWFGVPVHQDGVCFMDGFLLQLYDDKMVVSYRDNGAVLDYPRWWGRA